MSTLTTPQHLCPQCGQPLQQHIPAALPVEPEPEPVELERHELTDPIEIRRRMSEDLAYILRRRGEDAVIGTRDFERLGWTRGQVLDHAEAAYELAKEADQARRAEAA